MLKDVRAAGKAAAAWVVPVLLGRVPAGVETEGMAHGGVVCPTARVVLSAVIKWPSGLKTRDEIL